MSARVPTLAAQAFDREKSEEIDIGLCYMNRDVSCVASLST
jgi:hypothetical protein